jgi:phage baseplate assembly protein W
VQTDFVGSGWAFPVRTDVTGSIALVDRDRELQEAIRLVLGTSPGERPMRPEFGCRIAEHVFGVADAATAGQIAHDVRTALDRWEPRIVVDDVLIAFDRVDSGTLYIDVHYTVRDSNDVRNLVFPFYVIPDSEQPAVPLPEAAAVLPRGA